MTDVHAIRISHDGGLEGGLIEYGLGYIVILVSSVEVGVGKVTHLPNTSTFAAVLSVSPRHLGTI